MTLQASKPLSELVRDHRELCVRPLFWTTRLLELLGCRFQDVALSGDETVSWRINKNDGRDWQSQGKPEDFAERLAVTGAPLSKIASITRLLTGKDGAFEHHR